MMNSLELLIAFFVLSSVLKSAVSSEWRERDSGMTSSGNRPVSMVHDGWEADNLLRGSEKVPDAEGEYKTDGLQSSGYPADGLPFRRQESLTNGMPSPLRNSFLSLASHTDDVCMDFTSAVQSKVQSVVLLRTSCQYLMDNYANTPLTFSVDSTILTIVIEVTGTKARDTTIWDSGGAMINKRLKRSADYQQKDKTKTISTSSHLSQVITQPETKIADFSNQLFLTREPLSFQNQEKQHEKTDYLRQWMQQEQKLIRQGRVQEQIVKENLQEVYNTQSEDRPLHQQDYNHDFQMKKSPQKLLVFLLNQSQIYTKSRDRGHPGSLRQRPHPGTPAIAGVPSHVNSKTIFGHQDNHRKDSQPQDSQRQDSQDSQLQVGQGQDSPPQDSQDNQRQNSQRQDSHPTVYNHSRRKRTSRLLSMQLSAGAAVWEIEPQTTGSWTITVDGSDPVQVEVTAKSSLDFSFELLDNATLINVTSHPLANEPTIACVTFTSLACVYNVTMMSLHDVNGMIIANVELTGSGLYRMDKDYPNTIFINFQMPVVPFYTSISGYDVTGSKFQRLSSVSVVPLMFTLSLVAPISGPLVPGIDYTFEVRLRNNDRAEAFNFVAECDNIFCLKASVNPDMLQVSQTQRSQLLKVTVRIHPSISDITNGTLTVTALRMSDNTTETMTFEVTAEPKSFLQDHTAPICTTEWTSGGCRSDVPCENQHWAVSLSMTDDLTGVRSAHFVDPPANSFNEVQFSPTNKTARAEYRYICCKTEATILVYDYANNPSTCNILAPSLDSPSTPALPPATDSTDHISPTTGLLPPSPLSSSVPPEISSSIVTINKSHQPWTSTPGDQLHSLSTLSSTTRTHTRRGHTTTTDGNGPITRESSEGSSTNERSSSTSSQPGSTYTPVLTRSSSTSLAFNNLTSGSNSSPLYVKHNQAQSRTNSARSNALRLAATICASVGGAAGLAICILCFIHKITKVRERRRGPRRPRHGSDVTMGSSSESRSDGSSEVGSVRFTNAKGGSECVISSADFYKSPRKSQGVNHHTSSTVNESKKQTRNSRVSGSKRSGKDYSNQMDFRNVAYKARGRGQIEEKGRNSDNNDNSGTGMRFLEGHGKGIFNSTFNIDEDKTNLRKVQVCAQVEKTKRSEYDRDVTGTRRVDTAEGKNASGTNRVDTAEGKNVAGTNRVDTAERKNVAGTNRIDTAERKNIAGTNRVDTAERKNVAGTNRVDTAERKNVAGTNRVDTAERKNVAGTNRVDTAERKNVAGTNRVDTAERKNVAGINRVDTPEIKNLSGTSRFERVDRQSTTGTVRVDTADRTNTTPANCVDTADRTSTTPAHCVDTADELPSTPGKYRHEIKDRTDIDLSINATYDLSPPGAPQSKLGHIESQYKQIAGSSRPGVVHFAGRGTNATHVNHYQKDGNTISGSLPEIFATKNSSLSPRVEAPYLNIRMPVAQCLCQNVRDHVNSMAAPRDSDISIHQGSQCFGHSNFNTAHSFTNIEPFSQNSCRPGISPNYKCGVAYNCPVISGNEDKGNPSLTPASCLSTLAPGYGSTVVPMKLFDNGRNSYTGFPVNNRNQRGQGSKSGIGRQVHNRHARVLRARRTMTNGAESDTWHNTLQQHQADGSPQNRSLRPNQSCVSINGQENVMPGAVKQTKYDESVCISQQFHIAMQNSGNHSDTYSFAGNDRRPEGTRKDTTFVTKPSMNIYLHR